MNSANYLTPVQVARALGCRDSKVFTWCRTGAIKAVNLAANPDGTPRYKISQQALDAFLAARTVKPAAKPTEGRRKGSKLPANFVRYY